MADETAGFSMDRRTFLRGALRLAGLAGLVALGRRLAVGGGTLATERCPSGGACGGCPRLRACGLPRGQSARRVLAGEARP